jgi:hypothetical protein
MAALDGGGHRVCRRAVVIAGNSAFNARALLGCPRLSWHLARVSTRRLDFAPRRCSRMMLRRSWWRLAGLLLGVRVLEAAWSLSLALAFASALSLVVTCA